MTLQDRQDPPQHTHHAGHEALSHVLQVFQSCGGGRKGRDGRDGRVWKASQGDGKNRRGWVGRERKRSGGKERKGKNWERKQEYKIKEPVGRKNLSQPPPVRPQWPSFLYFFIQLEYVLCLHFVFIKNLNIYTIWHFKLISCSREIQTTRKSMDWPLFWCFWYIFRIVQSCLRTFWGRGESNINVLSAWSLITKNNNKNKN